MIMSIEIFLMSGFILFACVTPYAFAKNLEYAADVPATLITPDSLQTDYLGEPDLFERVPGDLTVQKAYDSKPTRKQAVSTATVPTSRPMMMVRSQSGLTPNPLRAKKETGYRPTPIQVTGFCYDFTLLWNPGLTTPGNSVILNWWNNVGNPR